MLRPFNWVWLFSPPLQPLMLVIVSVDRLLSVALPMKYLSWTSTYAVRLVGAAYGGILLQGITGLYLSLAADQSATAKPFCIVSETFQYDFLSFMALSQVFYGWASVFVYVIVVVVFVKRSKAAMK